MTDPLDLSSFAWIIKNRVNLAGYPEAPAQFRNQEHILAQIS